MKDRYIILTIVICIGIISLCAAYAMANGETVDYGQLTSPPMDMTAEDYAHSFTILLPLSAITLIGLYCCNKWGYFEEGKHDC